MAGTGSRDDLWLITVTVDGKSIGIFDKRSGGDKTAADTKYRPGGTFVEQSLGGPTSVANITISRLYDRVRDHALAQSLTGRVGRARVSVSQQPLDADGVAWGNPIRWTGTLSKVMLPTVDSTSSNPSMLELDVSVDGTIG